MGDRSLILNDDHIVAYFPYDADEVAAVKKIPGAKWDKLAKAWRIPMSSLVEARDFATRLEFRIDNQLLTFDLPKPKNSIFGIKLDGDFIYLSFRYDPVRVKAVKQIPAVTWHSKTKAWRAPITSIEAVMDWAEQFRIALPEMIIEHAGQLKHRHDSAVQASRSTDAQIDVSGLPLLPYQRAGVQYVLDHPQSFIADGMGLGKTLESIAAVEHADRYPVCVVCPPNLVLNWEKEYRKWLPNREVAVVETRKSFPKDTKDVVVVGYSNISSLGEKLFGFRSYIFDESHYVKSSQSQRTKAAIKMTAEVPQDGFIFCLTGTPVKNNPAEYASQLKVLKQIDKFGGEMGYYRRYCKAHKDKYGKWDFTGHSNLDELNERLRGICYIRRTKDQVLLDLPRVRENEVIVTGSPALMAEYREAEKDIVTYLVERARQLAIELGEDPRSAGVLAQMKAEYSEGAGYSVGLSVLRKLAARAKMEAVAEMLESHKEAGNKVIVAAHHRQIVDLLANQHGGLKIQGKMTASAVEDAKSRFQNESCEDAPVIVLSIMAGGEGHTLHAAQEVLFVELPWTPADVDQVVSRAHRLGQSGSVTATFLLCADTIDTNIYAFIEKKRRVVDVATEGVDLEGKSGSALTSVLKTFLDKGLEKAA